MVEALGMKCKRSKRRLVPLVTLATLVFIAHTALAQNPVDPTLSYCETICPSNVLLVNTVGPSDDLGHMGIVVTCIDAFGDPIPGIPASAFSLDILIPVGKNVQILKQDTETDEFGRFFLTGVIHEPLSVVHGSAAVVVDYMGDVVYVDNGGAGTPVEFRTPDFNGDGVINLSDVLFLAQALDCCEDTFECLRADFDGDGCVTLADVAIFVEYFGMAAKTESSVRPGASPDTDASDLFTGCIQRDFDTDMDPSTINTEHTAIPGVPFYLRLVAAGYSSLTGVRATVNIPNSLTVLSSNNVAPLSTSIPVPCGAGQECFIAAGPCTTTGPIFVREIWLMSTTVPIDLTAEMFPIEDLTFTDCGSPPIERPACVGEPTPCEASELTQGIEIFVTCPGGDMDLTDVITVTMRASNGAPIPGIPAADFETKIVDLRGSLEGDRFQLTPLDTSTGLNGELDFRFEPRENCSWDGCFDLEITVSYEACDKTIQKMVRTPNLEPLRDDGVLGVIDEINIIDLGAVTAALYTYDECIDFSGFYRCPIVTAWHKGVVNSHITHSCNATSNPPVLIAGNLMLRPNRPNPFNPSTLIEVVMAQSVDHAELAVFDLNGRKVSTLWSDSLPEGARQFLWDGTDFDGSRVASGVYIARIAAAGDEASVRMVLVK